MDNFYWSVINGMFTRYQRELEFSNGAKLANKHTIKL